MYWDHFFRFLVSSRVVKPKEAEALNESVYHFATGSFCGGDGTSSVQMKNWFHAFADRQLRELRRSVNWSVMWWCARSTSERRRFWTTILWPPERRALHAKGMRAAHCCVHLRQRLLMAHEACASDLHAFVLSAPDWRSELAGRTGKPHSATVPIQVHDQQTRKWLRVASRMTREARHLSPGYRPGWGMVHYNLACYYALCMMPGLRERQGASGKVEKFEDPTGIHDYWAQRVVFHLSRALRDPSGPLGAGALWWIGRDPDLRAFRRHWRFGDWKSEIQLPDKDAPGERAPRPRAPGGAFRHSGLWAVSPHH